MDDEAADLARVLQPGEVPGLSRVGRFVDALADGDIAPDAGGARSDVDDVRIRARDVHGTNGSGRERLCRQILPRYAAVGGLPDAATRRAEVVGQRAPPHPATRGHPTPPSGPDHPLPHAPNP